MSEKHTDTGIDPQQHAAKAAQDAAAAQAKAQAAHEKQQAARAEKEAQQAEKRAERVEEKAHDAKRARDEEAEDESAKEAKSGKGGSAKSAPAKKAAAKPAKKAAAKPAKKSAGKESKPADEADEDAKLKVVEKEIKPKQKPELPAEMVEALEARAQKRADTPAFRRQEWWRYKRLGGKHAPWRRPRGIHSKMRRHYKYRPPLVSIGYRGPRAARGLHPSGFEEVLVYRPEDLSGVDPKLQAARVGGTVGGRKAELIEKEADKLGIRVLNRRS